MDKINEFFGNDMTLNKKSITNLLYRFERLFFLRSRGLLGIDISHSSVRVLELSQSNQNKDFQVVGFGYSKIPKEAMINNCIDDIDSVANSVSEAVYRSESKLKNVAIAVSGGSVINKIIDVPCSLDNDELELFLSLNSDKYIPFPVDEVAMDFQKLNLPPATKNREKVLLTACRRETIDKQIAAINLAGLSVEVVDVTPFAIDRALKIQQSLVDLDKEGLTLIADIGDNYISCNLINNDGALFVWEETFQGFEASDDLSDHNREPVLENAFKSNPIDSSDRLRTGAEENFLEFVVFELRRALQRVNSSTNFEVKNLVLVGSTFLTESVLVQIQECFDFSVSVGSPIQDMAVASRVGSSELDFYATSLTAACGLALRGFA